ncbi:MAG: hypothetical protein LBQ24_02465 [Candidatus Peribacteria bacterium]|nr:hypothetical protein [Candidatus Peribacteria bacterium]
MFVVWVFFRLSVQRASIAFVSACGNLSLKLGSRLIIAVLKVSKVCVPFCWPWACRSRETERRV